MLPRVKMHKLEARERARSFDEVALGLTAEEASREAGRCLNCRQAPCVSGCPVEVDIPAFLQLVAAGDFQAAAQKVKEKNALPAICGRVCPQEEQCEGQCTLRRTPVGAVGIGALERFVADHENGDSGGRELPSPTGKRVAVVGSGPSGLTAAADLARLGHQVVIMEILHAPGGVLRYGIPEFRLPKRIVEHEVDYVKRLGVELRTNVVVGQTFTLDELREQYDAVYIATGAGLPHFMHIPGENLNGVYSANEFLTRVNLMKAYQFPEYLTPVATGRRVAVVGGGNTAMDSARTALRLGAEEVFLVYRRSMDELPARAEEIENAVEEGVEPHLLAVPVEVLEGRPGWVGGLRCRRTELTEPDASGRRRPVEVPGSEHDLDVDTVIVATGQGPNPLLVRSASGLGLNRHGCIVADPETGATCLPGVYAGGDIVSGGATVIAAMGAARRSARAIHEYLTADK